MHPYRDRPMFSQRKSNRPPVEELIIYALLMITGAIPVTNAIEAGGRVGVEATIGALMIAAGAVGIVVYAWTAAHQRRDVPAAQAVEASGVAGPDGSGSRNL